MFTSFFEIRDMHFHENGGIAGTCCAETPGFQVVCVSVEDIRALNFLASPPLPSSPTSTVGTIHCMLRDSLPSSQAESWRRRSEISRSDQLNLLVCHTNPCIAMALYSLSL